MVAMGLAYVLISLTSHSSERQRAAPAIKTASTGGKEQGAVSAAPKETAGAAAVATAAGPGPAIDLTPFSSIVKGENGEDRKLFKFPTESIGVISYEITNNLNQSKDYAANCHGNVTLPVNTGLRFVLPNLNIWIGCEQTTSIRLHLKMLTRKYP